jgi:hypothetical protein
MIGWQRWSQAGEAKVPLLLNLLGDDIMKYPFLVFLPVNKGQI